MLKITQPMFIYDTPFIGREGELKKIDTAIQAWGTNQIICIDGDGGIGKTRLLAETYRQYRTADPDHLRVLEIIDFDDSSFQIPGKVEQYVAETLGGNKFEDFWHKLKDLRHAEKTNVSQEMLANQKEITKKAFIEGLNNFSAEKRVAILFDTAEKQATEETWNNILNIVTQVVNLFVMVAGRDASHVWDKFRARLGDKIRVEYLMPLDSEASEQYLAEKQRRLRINVAPDVAQGLLVLAQGHPIFLDLAVEWVARDLPRDWIGQIAQGNLSTGDLRARKREFEHLLVGRIMEIRTPMDRLCLMLSRIYPLDATGIAELLKMDQASAKKLYDDALTYVFIKRLPSKRISLHDEMRRMINEYVWLEIDKSTERRMYESKLVVGYLKRKIEENAQKLTSLETPTASSASAAISTQPIRGNLLEISTLERENWVLQGQCLEHILFYDLLQGVNEFNRMFDDDSRTNPRIILLNVMLSKAEELPAESRYEVVRRQLKLFHEKGSFEQVLGLGSTLHPTLPEQQVDLLNKLANARLALGRIPEALSDLKNALEICNFYPDATKSQVGSTYNLLGMTHRQTGQYSEAAKYYNLSLAKATTKAQMGSILNNLGYVFALEGRYRSAATYCQEGLKIREKAGLKFETGSSLTTMGEINRNWGKYREALDCYNRALAIFEPENATLWLARLYSYRGAVYRLLNEYDQAERNLTKSIDLNIPAETPWAYHVLGCVYWNRGNLEQALGTFRTSEQLAIESNDLRSRVNNLVASAEIYLAQWLNTKKPDLPPKINAAAQNLQELITNKFDFPHHLGLMQRVLGDVAYEEKRYPEAMRLYAEAYAALGRRTGGYGKRTFLDEVESLSQKITLLSSHDIEEAARWCDYFLECWSDEEKNIMRRDELISMCSVHQIEIKTQVR